MVFHFDLKKSKHENINNSNRILRTHIDISRNPYVRSQPIWYQLV